MDYPRIIGADSAVEAFLDSWFDSSDSVPAHTSGSTGTPKLIRLKKADMIVSARATCQVFGISDTSHLVMPLSADYIAGKMMIVRAMVSGAALTVLPPSRGLAGVAEVRGAIDLLPIVPAQVEALVGLGDVSRLRAVIIGGAPLTAGQERMLTDAGISAYATYGMTETCSHVAIRRIGNDLTFTAMPAITFEADAEGCLIINAPDYTQGRFVTNDIVELDDDRHFRWLGRRDNVINSGGIKIMPEQVEQMLRPLLPGIDFYVTSKPSLKWGEELVLVAATDADISHVLEQARASMPHHLIPKTIVYTDALPRTPNGKLQRHRG